MIFIVDDDDSVRTSLLRLLRAAGLTAGAFGTAEEFLGNVSNADCDCVMIDVHLPGMSGLELQRKLRAGGSSLPVIMMTAFDDAGARRDALGAGAIAFLQKPFNDSALLNVLHSVLPENDTNENQE